MRQKDIVIGDYYRLTTTPNYSYVKPIRILAPKTSENPNTFIVVECEHTVDKNDSFGFIRKFKLSELKKSL